jgi:mono/diheme cytochrome c family protein
MNKSLAVTLTAITLFVIVFPIYGLRESIRMQAAQSAMRSSELAQATNLYVESCGACHGSQGEGLGVTPAINNDGLRKAEHEYLFKMISHPPHGTTMAVWHMDEGVNLSEYQVESLVTLIRYADWQQVDALAQARGLVPEEFTAPDIHQISLTSADLTNPHECVSCHEQPRVHADRFGLNCARCHSIQAWKPALLAYHTFDLEHGGEGKIACTVCHPSSYGEHTCYGCHDHQPVDMEEVHFEEGIQAYEYCAICHPTGVEDEGSLNAADYESRLEALLQAEFMHQQIQAEFRTENSRQERSLPNPSLFQVPPTKAQSETLGPIP